MSTTGNTPRLDRLPPDTTLEIRSELEEWIVREAYSCVEPHAGDESYHWTEYRLQERKSDARAWLSVELDDETWEAALFTRQVELAEVGYGRGRPFPDELTLDGQTFALDESGKLVATRVGSTVSYRGQYADYARGDGQVLSIEAYPDPTNSPRETDVEIWVGRVVEPRSLDINVADANESKHLVPPPLPNAGPDQPTRREGPPAAYRIRRLVNDPDQRNTRLMVLAGGAAAIVVILLLLAML
ncbi:MAG: hypothetical protein AVDCRST_MAG49-3319 [uncultured Thermomicrobiales bacterium]|uniref:DUF4178 domain-containing protein n=1 Tax=uncultured Thermomicrobiales bacterium TaxID=1645740 RepID=A0A6J4V3Z8_9BACT|nr:MAG: hypothetical protein AVDCRST_MAG49-3319 [uncultured Thermomicrobiales bacterium]